MSTSLFYVFSSSWSCNYAYCRGLPWDLKLKKVNIKLFESWLVLESTWSDWLAARDCERHSKAPIIIARDLAIFDVNSIKEEVNLKVEQIYLHYFRHQKKTTLLSADWKQTVGRSVVSYCKSLNRQFFVREIITTMEPRYNEVPRDWQNFFAVTGFYYIEVLFHIFYRLRAVYLFL